MLQRPQIRLRPRKLLKQLRRSRENPLRDAIQNEFADRAKRAESEAIESLNGKNFSKDGIVVLGFDFVYSSFRAVLEWGYSSKTQIQADEHPGVQLADRIHQAGMDLHEEGGSSDDVNLLLYRAVKVVSLATSLYTFSHHRMISGDSKLLDKAVDLEGRSTCDRDLKHLFWTHAGYFRMRALADKVWSTDDREARNRRVVRRSQQIYKGALSIDIHVEGPKAAATGILDATRELADGLQPTLLDYSR